MKTYQLPLTRNYVRNWTAIEAIREILQNAIDYGRGLLDVIVTDDSITVHSAGAKLEARTLLLGATSKQDDEDSIGSFGEGYKIALLVLARENIDVKVFNHGVTWTPRLSPCEAYQNEEVLFIDEEEDIEPDFYGAIGVTFRICGLGKETVDKVVENTLQLQDDIGNFHEVSQGKILLERPGKLYVNGLFVAKTNLAFGYNVKPSHLKLERDRQTVSSFDLQWLTKQMWFETHQYDAIAGMMEQGVKDLEYAQHNTPELVREACYRAFVNKHPGAVIASSQKELEELVSAGMTEVIVHKEAFAQTVASHPDYNARAVKSARVTPQAILKRFLAEQRKNMNGKSIEALNKIIKESAAWK